MRMKKIIAAFSVMLSALFACGIAAEAEGALWTEACAAERTELEFLADSPSENGKTALKKRSCYADDAHVRSLGRSIYRGKVRLFTYTCSGIEFEFTGTSADIQLTCGGKARIAVYVDDFIFSDELLEKGDSTLSVTLPDTFMPHKVTVVKLSEAGTEVGVKRISVVSTGKIRPTREKDKKIEFIGDSITCGYGIDSGNGSGVAAVENGKKTYAALAAERFGADYRICAWGGVGVYTSYTESSEPNRRALIGDLYGKQGMRGESWDFSKWQPDIVVINVGTNDAIWAKDIKERRNKFGEAYYELISEVRKVNPDAYIICSYGVMNNNLMKEIKKQVKNFSRDTGDEKVFSLEYKLQNTQRDGYGTSYHPSARTHRIMADRLSKFISQKLGWEQLL